MLAWPSENLQGVSMTRQHGAIPVVLLFFCSLMGCSDSPVEDSGFEVRDSLGIQIITNHDPQWSLSDTWEVQGSAEVRIGVREGDPAYEFGVLRDAKRLSNGSVVVSDDQWLEIRIFDSLGVHFKTVGRDGDGPGEFRRLYNLGRYRGDSIWAYDYGSLRISILTADGEFVRSVPNRITGNYWMTHAFRDGRFFLYSPGGPMQPRQGRGTYWDSTFVVALAPDGEGADTLASVRNRESAIDENGMPQPIQYGGWSVHETWGDGFLWGTSDRYEIRVFDPSGKLFRIIRRSVSPEPISEERKRADQSAYVELVRSENGDEAARRAEESMQDVEWAETVPFFAKAIVDPADYLWVQEYGTPWMVETRWSVFDPQGRWLGDVLMPDALEITDISLDHVVGIGRDDVGAQYVQVHRLSRAGH
jgi:hypothetical protein